ncbi:YchJ family protein [Craterilacuibacter sp.]|uniref:YchJ family protein n=1 Tax=Craterilacuibacter sp. TaxID=2870909 RepID=UPI003F4085EE
MKTPVPADSCPCGSGLAFAACCAPYLNGAAIAYSAQALMRSRYSAYVKKDEAYLLGSWHPSTRPECLALDEDPVKWLGLDIVALEQGVPGDTVGRVEFVARYKVGGRAQRLQENSRFVFEDGRWFYVDGDIA